MKGSRILIPGMAYKKNVEDDRESPSFKIMELLEGYGAHVDFNDPYVPVILGPKREYNQFVGEKSVSLDEISQYDMMLILTDHSNYDYKDTVDRSTLVVDTRNACEKIESDKIIKA